MRHLAPKGHARDRICIYCTFKKVLVHCLDLRAITQIDATISKLAATKVTKSVGSSQSKYIENFPSRPIELTSTKLANNAALPLRTDLPGKLPELIYRPRA